MKMEERVLRRKSYLDETLNTVIDKKLITSLSADDQAVFE